MRFGLHLTLINVLGALASSIDKVIIFHYLGAANVALYSIAQALPEQIDGTVSNVRHLALPKFANQDPRITIRTLPRKILVYVLLLMILVGAYALVAKPFFQLLFPEYLEAVPYSIALAFAFAATAPGQLSLAYLAAHGAIKERYILGLFFSGTWIILMIVFCRSFGLWGLVAAKLLIKYSGLIVGFWLAWRHAHQTSQTTFPKSL
jgi:O-antigen/teichoic acid export membrane protein